MSIIPTDTTVYLKSFILSTHLEHSAIKQPVGYVFTPLSYAKLSIKTLLNFLSKYFQENNNVNVNTC